MDNCSNCNEGLEAAFRPSTGEMTVRKASTVSARRARHALRLLHSLMLIAFGILVIGLMAANAFGSYMKAVADMEAATAHLASITSYEILTDFLHSDPSFLCIVFLMIFAIASVCYGIFMLLTQKTLPDLKLTTILLIYLPVFIIMCAFTSHVRVSETVEQNGVSFTVYTALEAGGISIFVLSVFFAIAQIAILIAEARIGKEEGALPEKPYVIAQYPYPAPPQPKDYSKEELAVYYNETLPNFNKGVELMKEHHPEFAAERRAAMKEYRAECRRIISELYRQKHNATCTYPLAYLWWNFTE